MDRLHFTKNGGKNQLSFIGLTVLRGQPCLHARCFFSGRRLANFRFGEAGEIMMKKICTIGVALSLLSTAAPVGAATVLFSGSRFNVDAPGTQSSRCGSRATTSVRHDPPTATSTGTSNFGAFTPTLSHCIQLPLSTAGPTPFDLGEFVFAFASGDSLFGTYSGSLSPLAPGQFSVVQAHLVTGGTGIFDGARGAFESSGTLSFLTGRPTVTQTFSGVLNVGAVPEPQSWAMMIFGFGVVGAAIRNARRARPKVLAGHST